MGWGGWEETSEEFQIQPHSLFLFQGKVGRWTRAYHLKVPPPPMPPQPPRGGPRQRILPTPRGVNMIVWSLDNRFVLAAIMGMLLASYVFSLPKEL